MVEISDLEFRYQNNQPLFSGFNWKVETGESWAVLGSSGSGKTTLLHLLASLKTPVSGEISIGGERLERPRPGTGLILQNHGLLPWATVEKNIELGFRIRRFYGPDGKHAPGDYLKDKDAESEQARYWMEKTGIASLAKRYPHQLSGGQQQRAAIARTMVLKPDLLLMDEPFSALDITTRKSLRELIMYLEKERSYCRILVTHSVDEALIMGEKILVLRGQGKENVILENSRSEKDLIGLTDRIHDLLGEDFEEQ